MTPPGAMSGGVFVDRPLPALTRGRAGDRIYTIRSRARSRGPETWGDLEQDNDTLIVSGMWEGTLALAHTLDRLCEGEQVIPLDRFEEALTTYARCDAGKVVSGLLASGLVEQSAYAAPGGDERPCLRLTTTGRRAILYAVTNL